MIELSIEIAIQLSKNLSHGVVAHTLFNNQLQYQAALNHEKWQAQTKALGELLRQSQALTGDSVDFREEFMIRGRLITTYTECADSYLIDIKSQVKAYRQNISTINAI